MENYNKVINIFNFLMNLDVFNQFNVTAVFCIWDFFLTRAFSLNFYWNYL